MISSAVAERSPTSQAYAVELEFRLALLSIIVERPPKPLPEDVKPPGLGPHKKANARATLRSLARGMRCGALPECERQSPVDPSLMTRKQDACRRRTITAAREFHYPRAFRAALRSPPQSTSRA